MPPKYYPRVSVCTPTFNRRPFIPMMMECFRQQTYPRDRMEWIIVDDGTDKIQDLIEMLGADLVNTKTGKSIIQYYPVEEKMTLGKKRNYMHSFCTGEIIVYMDDDDYYPKERVSHAVEMLLSNPTAMCAGSSLLFVFFRDLQEMVECGPYGPNHATAGTFAFRRALLKDTKYEDDAALAEERVFLKDYTVPFVQLDPMKTILVFSHRHNTFDKRKMLEGQVDPNIIRRHSKKKVVDFIQDVAILRFFLQKMDGLLADYAPGDPAMKPDVMEQSIQMEEDHRRRMMGNIPFILYQPEGPDGPQIKMTLEQTMYLVQRQQEEIQSLRRQLNQYKSDPSSSKHDSKLFPEIRVSIDKL